jgi:leucyl-tRNA synthetase
MDGFVCSSWYYLRFVSTHCQDQPFDPEHLRRWLPVDVYVGGPEHATGHLIYARYITKFLHDAGYLGIDEPFGKLVHQGIITHLGQRMSKSKGNVVNPDAIIDQYGSDCFRLYLMFMGDFTVGGDWSDEGIVGIKRFQNRIWRLAQEWFPQLRNIAASNDNANPELDRARHHAIREVTNDLDQFKFNTAVSRVMELVNRLYAYTANPGSADLPFLKSVLESLTLILGPIAPHMAEELWTMLGQKESVFNQPWAVWNDDILRLDQVTVVVQVNGKLVEKLSVSRGSTQEAVLSLAAVEPKVKRHLIGREVRKVVFVQDKILNLVV